MRTLQCFYLFYFFVHENMKPPSRKVRYVSRISVISEIYPYCPKLRRRPKLQNSCSLMWHIVEQLYKELGNWCGTIIERHSQKCKPWAKPPNNRSNGFIIAPIELRTGFPNCSMYAEEQNCCILRRLQWSHSEQIVIILFNFFKNCLEIWRPKLLNSQ